MIVLGQKGKRKQEVCVCVLLVFQGSFLIRTGSHGAQRQGQEKKASYQPL